MNDFTIKDAPGPTPTTQALVIEMRRQERKIWISAGFTLVGVVAGTIHAAKCVAEALHKEDSFRPTEPTNHGLRGFPKTILRRKR